LKGLRDDCIEVLNLLSSGDVHQKPFAEIADYCRRYSRGQAKTGKGPRDPFSRNTKQSSGTVTRTELGNLLENFKTKILSTISNQLDTLKLKKKQEEEVALAIFCHRCRKKHSEKECPLNVIEICGLCTL
jgi:ribosomal protein L44E